MGDSGPWRNGRHPGEVKILTPGSPPVQKATGMHRFSQQWPPTSGGEEGGGGATSGPSLIQWTTSTGHREMDDIWKG